jgi:hypothetical protein
VIDRLRDFFSPEQRRTIGIEARQALENKHWKEAFEAVEGHLIEVAKHSDPDNKEKAQRVLISMQLLEAIKRELTRKVEDGDMAQIQMSELERKNRPLRFIR